jgi:hypothetical protein
MDAVEQRLRQLIEEISAVEPGAENEDRERLTRLRRAVQGRLEGSGDDEHDNLVDSLEKAEIQFETDHPALAQSIRQALQVLSSSGI